MEWDQLSHAEDYLIYPQNMGVRLCIDETSISNGEVYTILSNDEAKCKKGSLIAIVKGTKSDVVSKVLERIHRKLRYSVTSIALDLSPSMAKIARRCFPHAMQVVDRFHVQKIINSALQDTRVKYRWEAQAVDEKRREECKAEKIKFRQTIFDNEETIAQLFVRSRYALMMKKINWKENQIERMKIIFDNFPEVEIAYNISQKFREIMDSRADVKDVEKAHENYVYNETIKMELNKSKHALLSKNDYVRAYYKTKLAIWYDYVDKHDIDDILKSVKNTFKNKHMEIINYFLEGFSNARAEALNSKIKDFRRTVKGVKNKTFFLFRLQNLLS